MQIKFKNPLENYEMEMSPIPWFPSHIHHKNTHSLSPQTQPPGPNINNIQIHKSDIQTNQPYQPMMHPFGDDDDWSSRNTCVHTNLN